MGQADEAKSMSFIKWPIPDWPHILFYSLIASSHKSSSQSAPASYALDQPPFHRQLSSRYSPQNLVLQPRQPHHSFRFSTIHATQIGIDGLAAFFTNLIIVSVQNIELNSNILNLISCLDRHQDAAISLVSRQGNSARFVVEDLVKEPVLLILPDLVAKFLAIDQICRLKRRWLPIGIHGFANRLHR